MPRSYQVTLDGLGKAAATQHWQVGTTTDIPESSQPPPTRALKRHTGQHRQTENDMSSGMTQPCLCCGRGSAVIGLVARMAMLCCSYSKIRDRSGGAVRCFRGEGAESDAVSGRARCMRFLLVTQQTKGASMRFRIAHVVVLVVALSGAAAIGLVGAAGIASAAPGKTVYTCSGGNFGTGSFTSIPSGNYDRISVTGVCNIVPGAVINVAGNIDVAPGAVLDAQSAPSTITVGHNVTAGAGLAPRPGLPADKHDRHVRGSAVHRSVRRTGTPPSPSMGTSSPRTRTTF